MCIFVQTNTNSMEINDRFEDVEYNKALYDMAALRTKCEKAFGHIEFNEEAHIYTMNGTNPPSVSSILKKYYEPFDEEYWSNRKAQELGVPVEDILKQWKDKNLLATETGSKIHYELECYACSKYLPFKEVKELTINNRYVDEDRVKKLVSLGMQWLDSMIDRGYLLFDTELIMGSDKYGYVGTADLIFWKDGCFHIYDWKTNNKEINGRVYRQLLPPYQHLGDTTLNHYKLQLNYYALLLSQVHTVNQLGIVHLTNNGVVTYLAEKLIGY